MIRINLLPVREARRRAELVRQAGLLLGTAAVALLGAFLVQMVLSNDISKAKQQIASTRTQIDGYKSQLKQVKEFRRRKEDVEAKLAVIAELERSRRGPVRVLDELSSRIPKRLWITSMDTSGKSIQLDGMGLNNEIVAAFLTALSESAYFADVELQKTELSESKGLKLSKFGIRARLTNPEIPAR